MTAPESLLKDLSRLPFDYNLGAAFMEIFTRRQTEIVDGVEVRGSAVFRACTREALELLRLSALFGAAQDHIAVIRQGRRSGMKAWADKPTFTVGEATWRHSTIWYAGAIARSAPRVLISRRGCESILFGPGARAFHDSPLRSWMFTNQ